MEVLFFPSSWKYSYDVPPVRASLTVVVSFPLQALGLPLAACVAGSAAGSGEDGPEGSKGGSDDRRSSCTLPQHAGLGLGATSESHYPGPVPSMDAQVRPFFKTPPGL